MQMEPEVNIPWRDSPALSPHYCTCLQCHPLHWTQEGSSSMIPMRAPLVFQSATTRATHSGVSLCAGGRPSGCFSRCFSDSVHESQTLNYSSPRAPPHALTAQLAALCPQSSISPPPGVPLSVVSSQHHRRSQSVNHPRVQGSSSRRIGGNRVVPRATAGAAVTKETQRQSARITICTSSNSGQSQ